MKIKIFTVGGTIDKVYFDDKSLYQVGKPTIADILNESNVTLKYDIDSILRKDSLDMNKKDRELVAKKTLEDKAKRIVVTHGTDTMVQTAIKVKKVLNAAQSKKTVVFTGSMTPANFKSSDATFNVRGAVIASQALPSGVYIVINGKIFNPDNSVKNIEKGCFEKIKTC